MRSNAEAPHLQRRLAFRDDLRQHPDACEAYAQLKRELADCVGNDIQAAHGDGKEAFVKQPERLVLAWQMKRDGNR